MINIKFAKSCLKAEVKINENDNKQKHKLNVNWYKEHMFTRARLKSQSQMQFIQNENWFCFSSSVIID